MTSEMTMGVMLAITVGAAIYVAWPLLVGRTSAEEYFGSEPGESALQRLMFQRDTTYAAMKELEFDLAMGNLSTQDFQQLQERYKRKAVALLKRIDDVKAGKRVSADVPEAEDDEYEAEPVPQAPRRASVRAKPAANLDVEQEIEAFRRRSKTQSAGNGAAPAATSRRPMLACPSCGCPITDPEAVFCSKCGATLRRRSKKYNQDKGDHHG